MNTRKEVESKVDQIVKDTDYYSPYSTINSIKELTNIIFDLMDELDAAYESLYECDHPNMVSGIKWDYCPDCGYIPLHINTIR